MNIKKTKIIKTSKIINIKGNLRKLLDNNSPYYNKFGEMYLTKIKFKKIKGWKCHKKMISNIFLISGKVKFVIVKKNKNQTKFNEFILNSNNYNQIYIPNNVFFAFSGLSKTESTLINFASIVHDSKETLNKDIKEFDYKWI